MELTIEQYIQQIYKTKSSVDEIKKRNIDIIHSQVSGRMTFTIPLYHVDAFNVNSCIVPLNQEQQYYHIVDHSTFKYFEEFLSAFEYKQPNLASAIYNQLRYDICMSINDEDSAKTYKEVPIYFTEYDLHVESLRINESIDYTDKFAFMARFYFLHEYMHFLVAKPIRKDINADFTNTLIDIFTNNMIEAALSDSESKGKESVILLIQMVKKYQHEYYNNQNFKEEITCDIQAILCLLELADEYGVNTIFESIITFVYTQYFVWLSKRKNEDIELGNIFHFRLNVLFQFAYMLEDKDFSDAICSILNKNNRYLHIENLKCLPIDLDKYNIFYNSFIKILLFDREHNNTHQVFFAGLTSDAFDVSDTQPNTIYEFSPAGENKFVRTQIVESPHSQKIRLKKLHNEAIKESHTTKNGYLDYLSLKSGGLKINDIKKYNKHMYDYIVEKYPSFFKTHSKLLDQATTTTLFIWEEEKRLFI